MLYKENRVKFLKTQWVHRRAILDKEELDAQRRKFAVTLGNVIKDDNGPIYFGKSIRSI